MIRPCRPAVAILLLAVVLAVPVMAAPAPGMDRLQDFLKGVQSMRASFRQEIVNANQEVVETAQGHVVLQRPGRFRWDYEQPFQRVVVADGTKLWLYEADLQQVTVRPLTAGLGETPAALLAGEGDILERFEYVNSWAGEAVVWLRLKPRSVDSDFESVAIAFSGNKPVQLELNNRLGQQTRMYLSEIKLNPPVATSEFHFEVPAGADVIREGDL